MSKKLVPGDTVVFSWELGGVVGPMGNRLNGKSGVIKRWAYDCHDGTSVYEVVWNIQIAGMFETAHCNDVYLRKIKSIEQLKQEQEQEQ